ncbi:hypothetical protein V6N13_149447 [Hibiscus sabdariffa]
MAKPRSLTLEFRLAHQAQSKLPYITTTVALPIKSLLLTDTPSSNPEHRFPPSRNFPRLVRTSQIVFPCSVTAKTEHKHSHTRAKVTATTTQQFSFIFHPIHNRNDPK